MLFNFFQTCLSYSVATSLSQLTSPTLTPSYYTKAEITAQSSVELPIHHGLSLAVAPSAPTFAAVTALPTVDHIELRGQPEVPSRPSSTLSIAFIRPTLLPRRETTLAPEIMGYIFTQGVYSSWNCHSGTYFSVSGYARCCPQSNTDCPVYTACSATSILYNDQYNSTCTGKGDQTKCVTGTIYESESDSNPKTMVGCWPSWTGGDWKATRTTPESSASTAAVKPPGTVIISKGGLAGVIIGCLTLGGGMVATGVFAPVLYKRWRDRRLASSSRTAGAKTSPAQDPPAVPPEDLKAPASPDVARLPPPPVSGLMVRTDSFRHNSLGTSVSLRSPMAGSAENMQEFPDRNSRFYEMEGLSRLPGNETHSVQEPQNARTRQRGGFETMI